MHVQNFEKLIKKRDKIDLNMQQEWIQWNSKNLYIMLITYQHMYYEYILSNMKCANIVA